MRTQLITLSQAVTVGGVPVTTLTMREPTIGVEEDALSMAVSLGRESNILTTEICLLSRLTGVTYDAVRQMPQHDYVKLRSAYDVLARPTEPKTADQSQPEAVPDQTLPASSKPSDAAS